MKRTEAADEDGGYRSILSRRGLNVPFNLDPVALDGIIGINAEESTLFPVRQLYFAEPISLTGNGRPQRSLPTGGMSLPEICRKAHDADIEVFLVMNAPSLGGIEWIPEFQDALRTEIGRIVDAGVDGLILTLPYLANRIRDMAPSLILTVSVNARIDTVTMLGEAQDVWGADRYYLHPARSRSFSLIRAMHQAYPAVHLVALVNESCLPDCPLQPFHQDYLAQTTRHSTAVRGPDYSHIRCALLKLSDDLYVLRSPWVPPHGIHYLFEAGISRVKLAGRTLDTPSLLNLIRAYARGEYAGDIWPFIEKSGLTSPEWEDLLGKRMAPCRHRVDNGALQLTTFFDYFAMKDPPCTVGRACGDCRHCGHYLGAITAPYNRAERIEDLQILRQMVEKDRWREPAVAGHAM